MSARSHSRRAADTRRRRRAHEAVKARRDALKPTGRKRQARPTVPDVDPMDDAAPMPVMSGGPLPAIVALFARGNGLKGITLDAAGNAVRVHYTAGRPTPWLCAADGPQLEPTCVHAVAVAEHVAQHGTTPPKENRS